MADETNQSDARIINSNQSNTTIHYSDVNTIHDNSARDLVLLILLSILIIVINGLITLSFILERKLRRRPANIMICSQACTDLFTGIIFVPSYLGKKSGELIPFLSCYMLYLSLFNLLVISIDRYLALSKPFIHHKIIDVGRTTRLIVIVWAAPLCFVLIPLCWWFEPIAIKMKAHKIYVCAIWTLMLILVVTMTALYIFATKRAKKTIRSRRNSCTSRSKTKAAVLARKELRVVHLFGLLLFFFVAAYLPILYINFVVIIGYGQYAPQTVADVGLYLLILNSVVNPILCIMLKKDYFMAIKQMVFKPDRSDDTWSLSSKYGSRMSMTSSEGSIRRESGRRVSIRRGSRSERNSIRRESRRESVNAHARRISTHARGSGEGGETVSALCAETVKLMTCHEGNERSEYMLDENCHGV